MEDASRKQDELSKAQKTKIVTLTRDLESAQRRRPSASEAQPAKTGYAAAAAGQEAQLKKPGKAQTPDKSNTSATSRKAFISCIYLIL